MTRRLPELFGWVFAAAVSAITVFLLMGGARGDVLFRDGDALLPVLIARSLEVGQPQDWALSSVLFVPELAVFLPLSWLGLPNTITLALAGAFWFTALYGAVRLVAGRRSAGGSPVVAAVLAHALFCVIALTEGSTDREALDLSSLLASSTYYAATVVACVASVGLVWRWVDGRRTLLLVALGVVSALSMFTNPLYAVWAIFPLLVIGFVVFRRAMLWPALVLVATGAAGLAARALVGDTIVLSGFGYIRPAQAFSTLGGYLTALGARLGEAGGLVATALITAVIVVALLVGWRSVTPQRRFVAAVAALAPMLVLVAFVAMGGEETRYLQPFAFAPVLLLTLVRIPRGSAVVGGVLAGAAVVAAVFSTALAVRTEDARSDADLACLVSYVNASDAVGGAQYWTVRLPKSLVDDPRDLVQIDHRLNGYAWLVNRADYDDVSIGYLVTDTTQGLDVAFAPADRDVLTGATEISCGRYSIIQLREPVPLASMREIG